MRFAAQVKTLVCFFTLRSISAPGAPWKKCMPVIHSHCSTHIQVMCTSKTSSHLHVVHYSRTFLLLLFTSILPSPAILLDGNTLVTREPLSHTHVLRNARTHIHVSNHFNTIPRSHTHTHTHGDLT